MNELKLDIGRIEDVLLLRASTAKLPSSSELVADVAKLLAVPKPVLERGIEALVASGQLRAKVSKRAPKPRFECTDEGRERLRSRFGSATWKTAAKTIAAAALGISRAQFGGKSKHLIPELVRRQTGLSDVREFARDADVFDALVRRELGIEGTGKLDMAKVRAAILQKVYGRTAAARRKNPSHIALDFVAAELHAQRNDKKSIEAAMIARWARSQPAASPLGPAVSSEIEQPTAAAAKPSTSQQSPVQPPEPTVMRSNAIDLEHFAARVQACADREHGVARFGDDKVFIASVWRSLAASRDPALTALTSVDAFKQRLLEAHQRRLLRLQRADLVLHMDRQLVLESELRYLNAQYHFIESPRRMT